jgi:glycosyltransferase involved in cell wall biosynthesis
MIWSQFLIPVRQCSVQFGVALISGLSLIVAAFNFWVEKRQLCKTLKTSSNIEPSSALPMKEPRITIVIATKNEARSIGQTMRNFENTTVDKSLVEIIIVDVGSSDRTIDVAKASSGSIPVIFLKKIDDGKGRGSAINQGCTIASGNILLILGSDCLVPPRYDEIIRKEFNDSNTLFAAFKLSSDKKASLSKAEPTGTWILTQYFNFRSSLFWFPSAMQGLILSSQTFKSHQFPDHVIMDDVALCLDIRSTCLLFNLKFKLLSLSISLPSNRWDEAGALTWIVLDTIALFAFINLHLCPESVYHLCHEFLPQLREKITHKCVSFERR